MTSVTRRRPTPSRRCATRTYRCRPRPILGLAAYGSTLSPHTPTMGSASRAASKTSPGRSNRLTPVVHSSASRRTKESPCCSLSAINATRQRDGDSTSGSISTPSGLLGRRSSSLADLDVPDVPAHHAVRPLHLRMHGGQGRRVDVARVERSVGALEHLLVRHGNVLP